MLWFGVITLFPETLNTLNSGITGRAIKNKLIEIHTFNPRDYTLDKHQSVDDHPYGGGAGMVMMAEPLKSAIISAKSAAKNPPRVIYLSPKGPVFTQKKAEELAAKSSILFLSGRYEGIDERIIQQEVDEECSIGNYILTGGELAAMVMIDATTRLIPGALGDEDSVASDSLTSGLLKYPQFTRPPMFEGQAVPSVLLSGHHQEIRRWRLKQSLGITWQRRKDLLEKRTLTDEERTLLAEFIRENP